MTSRARVAVISFHTSPLDQPGTGDSGGMNVYVRSVAERLDRRGVAVDVFTRCSGRPVPEVHQLYPRTRVIQVPAGPCAPVSKAGLPALVAPFAERVLASHGPYDLVHVHYWMSGRAGRAAKRHWGAPVAASFHTLGTVKNMALTQGERDPEVRLLEERATIADADLLFAPTTTEASHLVHLGASPGRIRVVPPGVDTSRFRPQDKERAKAALGLAGRGVVLFVGRLHPVKAPEVAIRAVAGAARRGLDPVLVIVGGQSDEEGSMGVGALRRVAHEEGIDHLVRLVPPIPHEALPDLYAAADVLLMPSRTESFGLAALEAQACGIPVVASAVGGLRHVVADGHSGLLVEDHRPETYAHRLVSLLGDGRLAARLGRAAAARARRLTWDRTADGVLAAYAELHPPLASAVAG
ncbi:MAG TPA: glycosyltransferase [Actinomycetota bacterium]|nr:glycosyltransferase [Actinomycetota bacterium]